MLSLLKRLVTRVPTIHPMIGKLVMDIECDGCMAHIHKLVRVGEIVAIRRDVKVSGTIERQTMVRCLTLSDARGDTRDDLPMKFFDIPIQLLDARFSMHRQRREAIAYYWRH